MDEDDFERACAASPTDDHLRLVFADWLEERGDDRARYLRLEREFWIGLAPAGGVEEEGEAPPPDGVAVDPGWVDRVGLKCDLVLNWADPMRKIEAIRTVRGVSGFGLKEAKDLVDAAVGPPAAPVVVLRGISLPRALQAIREARRYEWRGEASARFVVVRAVSPTA